MSRKRGTLKQQEQRNPAGVFFSSELCLSNLKKRFRQENDTYSCKSASGTLARLSFRFSFKCKTAIYRIRSVFVVKSCTQEIGEICFRTDCILNEVASKQAYRSKELKQKYLTVYRFNSGLIETPVAK